MGACGWSRCPRNRIWSHVAKYMAYSWFLAVGSQSTACGGLFGPFLGHIVELEGRKEHIDTGKSSSTWSVPPVSLRLPGSSVFHSFFGSKMDVFGPKLQFLKLRSATCESCSRPPPLSFSLKLCVIVLHTHRYHAPKFQPNPKHHDGDLIFTHFARVVACCLLVAAKPGRSSLDTKKGYKTKTGSTSSVTLALILTLTLALALTPTLTLTQPLPEPPPPNTPPSWEPSAHLYLGGGRVQKSGDVSSVVWMQGVWQSSCTAWTVQRV